VRTVEVALVALVVFLIVVHLTAKFSGAGVSIGGAS
jgi:hypothetical protein